MISKDVPSHLVVTARTGFLTTATAPIQPWTPIAEMINMTAASVDLVDLGGAPMPLENVGRPQMQDFIEKKMTVKPKDWEISVWISYNATKDDQTGTLERRVRAAGQNFNRHISQQAFKTLNDGDTLLGYDGLSLFNNAHVDKGAVYTTGQDNLNTLGGLSLNNLETAMVAARRFRDDQGNFTEYNYDLLVVAPEQEREAAGITSKNLQPYVVSSQTDTNPYAGTLKYLTSTQIDSTASILVASSEATKPVIIAMRERPSLQSAWFDPKAPDGGRYYFKFYARYNHFVGDWRLVYMLNT